jgi:PAS domain S-box-containing protein
MTPTSPDSKSAPPHQPSMSASPGDYAFKILFRSSTLVVTVLILVGFYLTSLYSYLLFHTLTEMFTIIISGALFLLVWNVRQRADNHYVLFIGISFLFVAAFDLFHALAYSGMTIFPGYDANLPTQLWITARYLQSCSLLAAVLFIKRPFRIWRVMSGYGLVSAVLFASIFARLFPVCYIPGMGLTSFKIISEYVIIAIFILASWGLWRSRSHLDGRLVQLVILANGLTIAAELAFTSYISVYGTANLIGHLLRITSSALFYYATVRAGILQSIDVLFGNLHGSEVHLRRAESMAQLGNWEFRQTDNKVHASVGACLIFGVQGDEFTLTEIEKVAFPGYWQLLNTAFTQLMQTGQPYNGEFRIRRPNDGQVRDIHAIAEFDAEQQVIFGTIQDISERKLIEAALKESESRYRLLFENMEEGFALHEIITDVEGNAIDFRIMDANSAYEHHTGLKPQDIIGKTILEIMPQADPYQIEIYGRVAASGKPHVFEYFSHTFNRHMRIRAFCPQPGRFATIFEDISERKLAEQALGASEQLYRDIFENNSAIKLLIDPLDGMIVKTNQAAAGFYGWPVEVLEHMNINQVSILAVENLNNIMNRAANLNQTHFESRHKLVSGEIRDVEIYAGPSEVNGRKLLVYIIHDISDSKESEKALLEAHAELEHRVLERTAGLKTANEALEKAMRVKDEFLATMSHELRTPLAGILGLSQVLQLNTYGEMNEKQTRAIENIEKSGRHLLELINEILDLSKLQAGKVELALCACLLTDICTASIEIIKNQAEEKKHELTFSISPNIIVLKVDEQRIRQVLINLLSNAIKFTPDGGRIEMTAIGDAQAHLVRISVSDTGVGIKEEDLPRLFQPFLQLDARLSRLYNGTGLGLSLVKMLVELHGGRVEVESTFGQGSRFTVLLPWDQE